MGLIKGERRGFTFIPVNYLSQGNLVRRGLWHERKEAVASLEKGSIMVVYILRKEC